MSWYRQGSISIAAGSATVIGTGTAWLSQCKQGDILQLPSGALLEINAVVSDTQLTLFAPHATAVTNSTYAIIRNFTDSVPGDLATQLARLLQRQGNTLLELEGLLGSSPSTTLTLPDGTTKTVTPLGALGSLSAYIKTLLDDPDAQTARQTLGVPAAEAFIGRNALINGDFDIAQRGSYFAAQATGLPIMDMWRLHWAGAGVSVQRGQATSAVPGPYGLRSWLQINGATGNSSVDIENRIEARDAGRFCNQNTVLSAYVFNNTGVDRVFVLAVRIPNNVDDWSSSTVKTSVSTTIPNGQWRRIVKAFTGDSTFANGCGVSVNSSGALVAGQSMLVSGVQLELGSVPSVFEQLPTALREELCLRHYERVSYRVDVVGGMSQAPFTSARLAFAPKRALPTLSRISESLSGCTFNSFQQQSVSGASVLYTPSSSSPGVASATLVVDAGL